MPCAGSFTEITFLSRHMYYITKSLEKEKPKSGFSLSRLERNA
jgi:hypothetical protein